jgi:cysteinyl-tRNA synthetase
LFFDILRRYLEHPRNGFRVTYVQNVTDIDDRSIATAEREGTTYDQVVARYHAGFKAAMQVLGVREPDVEPYATAFIPEIVVMIGELIARGYAYATRDGVYYKVTAFPRYGALSGKNVDELLVGARIAENEHKHDPLDFALWKFAKPGEPRWESPWGPGRPGWHIECSAMSRALLGVPFDLHGGGYDLIFPHHENEIAQSEPLMDHPPMARTWVHGGLLNFENRKMSKSLGNFEPLTDLLARHDPYAIRLLFLQTGYRKPMNFSEESIAAAQSSLEKLANSVKRAESAEFEPVPTGRSLTSPAVHRDVLFGYLDDDMNTAGALGALHDLAGDLVRYDDLGVRDEALALMRDVCGLFGIEPALDRERPAEFDAGFVTRLYERAGGAARAGETPEAAIEALIARRNEARKNRDFALGDRLRDALAAEGIALKDSKDGTTWTVSGA